MTCAAPRTLAAALVALLAGACGQNYSDKPAAQALAETNLTPVAGPPHPASPHPAMPARGAAGGLQSIRGVSLAVPAGWQSVPPTSSMRVAEYQVPAAAGGATGSNLAVFAGNWGSVDDNVNRWLGQFTQPDGTPAAATAKRWELQTEGGLATTMVDVDGTYSSGMGGGPGGPDYRMVGAIVDLRGEFLYLKLTGPRAEVGAAAAPFEQMVRSMRKG